MTVKDFAGVIAIYFSVAAIILYAAHLSLTDLSLPILTSVLLLIPLYLWHRNHRETSQLSKTMHERGKGFVLFFIVLLFGLAMLVRIPSALLFGMPYEKTPLIYLLILTIVLVEKTEISAFGFKTKNISKAIFYGLIFYALFGLLGLAVYNRIFYAFTSQTPLESFNITSMLLAMPFMTLCVGISEEGLFRGYIQSRLERFCPSSEAIVIQAALFGAWHFVWNLSPFDLWGMTIYVAETFFIGLMFGYFFSKARNLTPLILAHGLWNSVLDGIVTNELAIKALEAKPIIYQIFPLFLSYVVSAAVTLIFIKLFVSET